MKFSGAVFGSAVYLVGLIIVQSHLLRHGIFDLSAFEFYYLIVGVWLAVTLVPALLIIANVELLMQSSTLNPLKILRRYPAVAAFVALLVVSIGFWIYSYRSLSGVFNFNCYFFPKWYVGMNILWANFFLLLAWLMLTLLKRSGVSGDRFGICCACLATVYVLIYSIAFGRTIYSAVDQGFAGGAPQLAEVETEGGAFKAILLFSSNTGKYLIKLDAFPDDVGWRDGYRKYVGEPDNPVHDAMLKNAVFFLPSSQIEGVTVHNVSQSDEYYRHLR